MGIRGWAFQESIFSRRLLIFEGAVSWICGRCVWLEELPVEAYVGVADELSTTPWPAKRLHLGVPMGMMSLIPTIPSLGRWGMIVENYSSLLLTYPSDVTRALTGATEIMSSTFPGGILHGIPRFFFDIGLLWQPNSRASRRDDQPSWSWIGWQGEIECLKNWYPHYPGVYRESNAHEDWMPIAPLKPVAKYRTCGCCKVNSEGATNLNGFYKYQAMRENPYAILPPGWQRHHHYEGDFYTNPEFRKDGFRYTFPLPTANQSAPESVSHITSDLFCTAPIASLYFGEYQQSTYDRPSLVSIRHNGKDVGLLVPNQDDLSTVAEEPCELVALSETEIHDPTQLYRTFIFNSYWKLNSRPTHSADLEHIGNEIFYNVVWIGREENRAYRKGLGIVVKGVWDTLGAKSSTIVLN